MNWMQIYEHLKLSKKGHSPKYKRYSIREQNFSKILEDFRLKGNFLKRIFIYKIVYQWTKINVLFNYQNILFKKLLHCIILNKQYVRFISEYNIFLISC